jgi:hypothetical protein
VLTVSSRKKVPMIRLRAITGVLALLVLAGCGSTPTDLPVAVAPPAPPVEAEDDTVDPGHVALLTNYWEDRNAAFAEGVDEGVKFVVDHLHPALGFTVEDCSTAWFGEEPPARFRERSELHPDTIAPAPDWTMDRGPLQDAKLADHVYVMHLDRSYSGVSTGVRDGLISSYLQVVRGQVRNFMLCEVPRIASAGAAPVPAPDGQEAQAQEAPADPGVAIVDPPAGADAPPGGGAELPAELPWQPPGVPVEAPSRPAPPPPPPSPSDPAVEPGDRPGGDQPSEVGDGVDEPSIPVGSREGEDSLDFCLDEDTGKPRPGEYLACGDLDLFERWNNTLMPQ